MISITETELLEALQSAQVVETDRPPNTLTTVELAEMLGISYQVADRRVRAAWKAGTIECVRVPVQSRDGAYRPQPAYRVKR